MIHIFLLEIVSGWVTLTHVLETELLKLIYYFNVMINIFLNAIFSHVVSRYFAVQEEGVHHANVCASLLRHLHSA